MAVKTSRDGSVVTAGGEGMSEGISEAVGRMMATTVASLDCEGVL